MKRIVLLIITVALFLTTLTSCIIITTHKNFEIDENKVSSIEIYDSCKTNNDFSVSDKAVYKIEQEKISDFLTDLAEIQFSSNNVIALAAIDAERSFDTWIVRVNYTDGSCDIISCASHGERYNKNGELSDFNMYGCDKDEWWTFIEKYLPEDIFNCSHENE